MLFLATAVVCVVCVNQRLGKARVRPQNSIHVHNLPLGLSGLRPPTRPRSRWLSRAVEAQTWLQPFALACLGRCATKLLVARGGPQGGGQHPLPSGGGPGGKRRGSPPGRRALPAPRRQKLAGVQVHRGVHRRAAQGHRRVSCGHPIGPAERTAGRGAACGVCVRAPESEGVQQRKSTRSKGSRRFGR